MFTHYRTKALTLKSEERGEADRLFSLFTEDFGRIEVLGKAIRKTTSKLRSGVKLASVSEIEFIQGKTYKILTDAVLIFKPENVLKSPERLNWAGKILEITSTLTPLQESDVQLWSLLKDSLEQLNQPERNEALVWPYFFWNFVKISGYSPDFFHCARCAKPLLPETLFFLPSQGGVVCWRCIAELPPKEKEEKKEIFTTTIKLIRFFQANKAKELARLKEVDVETLNNLTEITGYFLDYIREHILSFSKIE